MAAEDPSSSPAADHARAVVVQRRRPPSPSRAAAAAAAQLPVAPVATTEEPSPTLCVAIIVQGVGLKRGSLGDACRGCLWFCGRPIGLGQPGATAATTWAGSGSESGKRIGWQ